MQNFKLISALLFTSLLFLFSCDEVDELTDFDISSGVSHDFQVNITQPSLGVPIDFNQSAELDITEISEIQKNVDFIQSVAIDAIHYEFKNYEGNDNSLSNIRFTLGNKQVDLSDIPLKETNNPNQFSGAITDPNVLSAVAEALKNQQKINVGLRGTLAETPAKFDVILSIDFTVTIDPI